MKRNREGFKRHGERKETCRVEDVFKCQFPDLLSGNFCQYLKSGSNFSCFKVKSSLAWRCMPVTPVTQSAEEGGLKVPVQPQQLWEALSNLVRLSQKELGSYLSG